MELNNSNNSGTVKDDVEEKSLRKKEEAVTSLYQYSDLSIKNIAQELRMPLNDVQSIADKLSKLHAVKLFEQESTTKIEKIMSTNIVSLDISKTAADAAALMTEKKVGSVIVTKNNNKLFGIVTERDLVRRYFRDTLLERLASHPLVTANPTTTIEKVAELMLKNKIRKLPIVDENKEVRGIVTVTDLGKFLLSTRRPGLTFSILQAISRGKGPRCDSCNSETEIQWCESCNRFMCIVCEDQIHTVGLP
jgi:CBS domain-containing protein